MVPYPRTYTWSWWYFYCPSLSYPYVTLKVLWKGHPTDQWLSTGHWTSERLHLYWVRTNGSSSSAVCVPDGRTSHSTRLLFLLETGFCFLSYCGDFRILLQKLWKLLWLKYKPSAELFFIPCMPKVGTGPPISWWMAQQVHELVAIACTLEAVRAVATSMNVAKGRESKE